MLRTMRHSGLFYPRRSTGAVDEQAPDSVCVTLEELTALMHLPLPAAAKRVGLCATTFKKACRRVGVKKWPYRPTGNQQQAERQRTPPVHLSGNSPAAHSLSPATSDENAAAASMSPSTIAQHLAAHHAPTLPTWPSMHQDVAYQAWQWPHSPARGRMDPFPTTPGDPVAGCGHILSLHTTMTGVISPPPASRDASRHLHPAGTPDHAAGACVLFAPCTGMSVVAWPSGASAGPSFVGDNTGGGTWGWPFTSSAAGAYNVSERVPERVLEEDAWDGYTRNPGPEA